MNKRNFVVGLSAVTLVLAVASSGPASAQQYYGGGYGQGQGMMGPGMMGQGMMGQGMMGPGMMGPGMMGQGMMGSSNTGCGYGMMGYGPMANLNLSVNDVKTYLDRWIAMSGNPHIKAGPVTEKDSSTITADVLTTDKEALVQRYNVDRRTGFWQSAQ
ncbi:hypothetical protein [Xanthobacter versatilis]|uniref:hypothetical protein n=1 Tax=Xanthobacter autotrophicus (strain ATCC BAA-1158 / Py2) TaxID=78245 RepID=UPI0037296746